MNIKTKQMTKLISGFIVLLFLGTTLAWSVFLVPIESTFGWTRSQTSFAATVCTMFFSIGAIVTGVLSKRISFTRILQIAGILLVVGFFVASIIQPGMSIFILYLSYGALVGGAAGMGYNCILSVCPMWMSDKPATASGILLMGYALSTAIFAPVINILLNVTNNVSMVFRILGIVCGVGVLLFSFLVRIPNLEELEQLPKVDRNANKKTFNIITADMVKMPLFWVYFLITIFIAGVGFSVINHNSPILMELGSDANLAAIIVSVCAVCNGLSRLAFGFIYDRLSVKKSVLLILIVHISAISVVLLGFIMHSIPVYIIGACLLMVSFGFNATSMPGICREVFGHRTFSLNYSVLNLSAFINAFIPSVVGLLQTGSGSYRSSILILWISAIISIAVVLLFVKLYNNEMKKREAM